MVCCLFSFPVFLLTLTSLLFCYNFFSKAGSGSSGQGCDYEAAQRIFARCSRLVDHYVIAIRLYTIKKENPTEKELESQYSHVVSFLCGLVHATNACTLMIRQLCNMPVANEFVFTFDQQSRNLRRASDSFCQAHNYVKVNFGCLAGIQPTIDNQCKRKLRRNTTGEADECALSIEYYLECNRYVARTLCGKASGDARASLVMLSVLKFIQPAQNPCAVEQEVEMAGSLDSFEEEVFDDTAIWGENDREWMELGEESFSMPKNHETIYLTRLVPVFGADDEIAKSFTTPEPKKKKKDDQEEEEDDDEKGTKKETLKMTTTEAAPERITFDPDAIAAELGFEYAKTIDSDYVMEITNKPKTDQKSEEKTHWSFDGNAYVKEAINTATVIINIGEEEANEEESSTRIETTTKDMNTKFYIYNGSCRLKIDHEVFLNLILALQLLLRHL